MRDSFFSAWARPVSAPRSPDSASSAAETSSAMRAAFIIRARSPASLSSSPASGAKSDSSLAAARTKSASAWARSARAFNSSSAARAAAHSPCSSGHRLGIAVQAAEPVQQGAMGGGVEQAAIVLLAMHFQQQAAQVLQQAHAHRLVIDEGAAAPVAGQGPAQHDLFACASIAWSRQQRPGGMALLRLEHGGGGALRRARRARAARPRPPTARPSESSRMDLPAPVSPVSTFRPGANSSAACSIRTMSRMVSAASTPLCRIVRRCGGKPD